MAEISDSDECYTPPLVYDAVRKWACKEYGFEPNSIVRPFYFGGDYEHFPYRADSVVVDNPPFSILSQICAFYLQRNVKFFLFIPTLTAFGQRTNLSKLTYIIAGNNITYNNGVQVPTSYVTNCDDSTIAVRTAPDLTAQVDQALAETYGTPRPTATRYDYPNNLLTPAMLRKYSNYGIDIAVRRNECIPVAQLDGQIELGKEIYGGGLLVSDRIAAERTGAEQSIAIQTQPTKIELSEREKELISTLSK